MRIKKVIVCEEVNSDFEPLNVRNLFLSSHENITILVELEKVIEAFPVKFIWESCSKPDKKLIFQMDMNPKRTEPRYATCSLMPFVIEDPEVPLEIWKVTIEGYKEQKEVFITIKRNYNYSTSPTSVGKGKIFNILA